MSKKESKNLILMTVNYPLGGLTERAFLLPELKYLRERFDRVILVPLMEEGPLLEMPEGVEYSDCVARSPFTRHKLLRPLLAHQVPARWLRESPSYALASASVARELKKFAKSENLTGANTVCYSFWMVYSCTAMALLKRATGIPFVSRAHTYDIKIAKAPATRAETMNESSGVWAISRLAKKLVDEHFPALAEKSHISYLGVEVPATAAVVNENPEEFNVVSLSRFDAVKRLELNMRFMRALAAARPDIRFSWTHIGGSAEEVQRLREMTAREESSNGKVANLEYRFLGNLEHEKVIATMLSGRFDIYLLLSRSEGVPVAMMEAMACGLPAVVTNVGGISEAHRDECGVLLSANPTAEEFVERVLPLVEDRAKRARCGAASRDFMLSEFDSRRHRADWAATLSDLI